MTAGLTPTEALSAATAHTADVFLLPDRGRICPGLRADLVLIDGHPHLNIADTQRITAVWKHGTSIDLSRYTGSADEHNGITALHTQTTTLIAAIRETLSRSGVHPHTGTQPTDHRTDVSGGVTAKAPPAR